MSVLCWLERCNKNLQGVYEIEVLPHVNSGSLEMWGIRFPLVSWSHYVLEKIVFLNKTLQREMGSIKHKTKKYPGSKAEKKTQTNSKLFVFTLQKMSILKTYFLQLWVLQSYFSWSEWAPISRAKIIPLHSKANQLFSRIYLVKWYSYEQP